jgi:SNF2 family DNA or RNA helicase
MKLKSYQKKAIIAADNYPFVAFFMKPGTGKTLPAILSLERAVKQDGIKTVLIVCVKTLMFNWEIEIGKYLEIPHKIFSLRFNHSSQARIDLLEHFKKVDYDGLKIVIVNYEKAIIMRPYLASYGAEYYIVDESHYIKNHRAKRSKSVYSITRKAARGLILTGTPIAGGYEDLYMQVHLMYPGILGTWAEFRNKYLKLGGFQGKQIVGYKNTKELNKILKPFIVTADSIIKKPEEMFIAVELPPKARKIYDQLNSEMVAELEEISEKVSRQQLKGILQKHSIKIGSRASYLNLFMAAIPYLGTVTTDLVIVKHLRMLQLCGGFLPLDSGAMEFIHDSKATALLEYLVEYKTTKPVIIFARFVSEIEYLHKILSKFYRVANFRRSNMRDKIYLDFQQGKYDILLMQIGSGGSVGLNLQISDTVIFYSLDDSGDHLEQAVARIRRTGQLSKNLQTVYIVCENTIETKRVMRTKHKSKINEEFLKNF